MKNRGLWDRGLAESFGSGGDECGGTIAVQMVVGTVGMSPKAQGDCQLGPAWFWNFQYSKSSENFEFKSSAFPRSKNIKTLEGARFRYNTQHSPLSQLQIPTVIHAINFGIDSNLNVLSILKGFQPCGKNLKNSPKISLDLIYTKVNLVGITCTQEIWVSIQVSTWLDLKIRKEFEFEIQTTQYL
jgi:hypothetical protein